MVRYLVVGGSIAGPAAAYFLKKGAPDATVVIVERAPRFRDGGQVCIAQPRPR